MTLTQAASVTKILGRVLAVAVILILVGKASLDGFLSWYKKTHPKITPPTVGFGLLPGLKFGSKEQPVLSYKLETVTGKLPDITSQVIVLFMPAERPNLLAYDRAVKEASILGFTQVAEKVSDREYRFRQANPIIANLTMQIYDGRFTIDADWGSDPNFLLEKNLPSLSNATKESIDYIKRLGESITDVTEANAKIKYLKGVNNTYQETTSFSEADFIEINLFRTSFKNQYRFVTNDPDKGIINLIISGNKKAGRFVHVDYNYFPVDYMNYQTYPTKPVALAWQEVLNGLGYIARVDNGVSTGVVRKVEIAYYDSYEPQYFVQPVYVFTGDDNLVIYVSAVGEVNKRR